MYGANKGNPNAANLRKTDIVATALAANRIYACTM